jgi:hypothetical protein
MLMIRKFVVAVMSIIAVPAFGTTLIAMDVPALTRAADLVVLGKVVRVESRWTEDKRRIMTDSEIVVSDVLKGNITSKTVVAMQPGGVVGDVGQMVHGTATFTLGDEVVVFLEKRGDRAFVVGMAQGRFLVDRSGPTPIVKGGEDDLYLVDAVSHQPVAVPVRPMTLAALIASVRENLGPPLIEPNTPGPGHSIPKVKTP